MPKKKKSVYVASGPWQMVFLDWLSSCRNFFFLDIFPNFNDVLLSASFYFYGRFVHCSSNYAFNSFLSQFVF